MSNITEVNMHTKEEFIRPMTEEEKNNFDKIHLDVIESGCLIPLNISMSDIKDKNLESLGLNQNQINSIVGAL